MRITATHLLVRLSAWKAKMRSSVKSNATTVTGWNLGRKRFSNHSLSWDFNKAVRVRYPAAKGITMNTTTEVMSTLDGTTTSATPRRNMTMGANRTSMMRSFTATWTKV